MMFAPVVNEERDETKNTTILAISSGVPSLFNATLLRVFLTLEGFFFEKKVT